MGLQQESKILVEFSIDGTPLKAGNSLEAATLMFNSLRQCHTNIKMYIAKVSPLLALQNVQSDAAELSRNGFFESAIELQKRIGDRLGEMEHCGSIGKIQCHQKIQ